jgi:L-gulonolactone oxidase
MSQSPKPIDDAKPSDGPEYGEEAFAGISTEHLYQKLQPITVPSHSPRAHFNNWGQTWYCTPLAVFEPETVEQCGTILELARREGKVVRAVGVGHSPSDLACTTGFMIRMTRMNKIIEVSIGWSMGDDL